MGTLLLVAATADEEHALTKAFPEDARPVPLVELRAALDHDVDTVVVGTDAPAPLSVVQWVHRVRPLCGVVLLTTADTDGQLRRSAMYAPDMPASLTVLDGTRPDLADEVAQAHETSVLQRAHHRTLTAVSEQRLAVPHAVVPASLGALLDHAPFGVVVGTVEGRLVSWNRWAGDLLELSTNAAGRPVPSLFPSPEGLEALFALARTGGLPEASAPTTVEGPGEHALEVSAAPTRLDSGEPAVLVMMQDVTSRQEAERTRDRLAEHVGLLGRVSEALAGTLDVDTALRRLADRMVPGFADWVSLHTHDERGGAERVLLRHRDRALEQHVGQVRDRVVTLLGEDAPSRRVLVSGQPVLLATVTDQDLESFLPDEEVRAVVGRLGVGSILSVPLPGREEVRGALTLVRGPSSPPYTGQELAVGVEVGRRAGVALDTIALYAGQRDLAAELQRSLLTEPPQTDHADVVVRYVAAAQEAQVGGDWYDAFLQADGSTVLVIGDVMGHDTRAAAAMGQLRALLRGISYTTGTGPAEMLSRLDAAIEGLRVGTTATGLVVRVDPRRPEDTGPASICWSNAGHPPPIVVDPGAGAQVLANDEPDLLLGVLAHTERQEKRATLRPGSTLLLYTDGLIERRDEALDRGVRTLTETVDRLAHLPLSDMCDRLLAELLPEEPDDDVALVAVRLRSPAHRTAGREVP